MLRHEILFRIVAVLLLLLTGAEMFACELVAPATCELSSQDHSGTSGDCGDHCLCCCIHVVVSSRVELTPELEAIPVYAAHPAASPTGTIEGIYHPPRG